MPKQDFRMKEAKELILNTYFADKFNTPPANGVKYFRTTQEIRDELSSMVSLSEEDVLEYLNTNHFALLNDDDGSVKWGMWREVF